MKNFIECTKQEAVNALRNAAVEVADSMDVTKKKEKMVSFIMRQTQETSRQTLETAMLNVIRCREVGWTDRTDGYNLVMSIGPRVLFYKANPGGADANHG